MLTLWFIDTDRFKTVNDTFGHAAGDAVLQGMAELLRVHGVPDVDVAGRNGGDEFCALIHDAQKTVAIERAQAFCDAVRRHDFGIALTITTSIGVASSPTMRAMRTNCSKLRMRRCITASVPVAIASRLPSMAQLLPSIEREAA